MKTSLNSKCHFLFSQIAHVGKVCKSLFARIINPEKNQRGRTLFSVILLIHIILIIFVWFWYEKIGNFALLAGELGNEEFKNGKISDERLFKLRGEAVLEGKIPYRDFYLPTGPLMPYLYCLAPLMAMMTPIHVTYWFRVVFSVFNAITSYAIYQGFKTEEEEEWGYRAGYLYGLNPLIIFMAIIWGTDETIMAAFFALAAWQISRKSWFWASTIIIMGACAKYFPIFLLPFLLLTRPRVIEGIIVVVANLIVILATYLIFLLIGGNGARVQFERFLVKAPVEKKEDQGIWCFLEGDGYFYISSIPFPIYQILVLSLPMLLAFWIIFSERGDYTRMAAPGLLFVLLYSKFQSSYLLVGLWGFVGSMKIRDHKIAPSFLVIIPIVVHGITYLFLQKWRSNMPIVFYSLLISLYFAFLVLLLWKVLPQNAGLGEKSGHSFYSL